MYIRLMRSGITAVVALISLNLVSSVQAQAPSTFVNLGVIDFNATVATPNTITVLTGDFNVGEIKWFQFTLITPILTSSSHFLDIYTTQDVSSSESINMTDSEIGIYNSLGNPISSDDDSGASGFSQLTYGLTTEPRVYANQQPSGTSSPLPFDGRSLVDAGGTLPAGTYWLATGRYDVTFTQSNWGATSSNSQTTNTRFTLVLGSGTTTAPEPGTISLFVLGGAGFLTCRKRKSA
jgi:hypothetical protein